MFRFALLAGTGAEWLFGPAAHSLAQLGSAGLRALLLTLAAWAALEVAHVLWRAVLTLDHRG
jgi:hypothetical protein